MLVLSTIAVCLAAILATVSGIPVRQNVLVSDLASFLADHTYQPSISALDSITALTSKGRRLTYKQVYKGVGKTYEPGELLLRTHTSRKDPDARAFFSLGLGRRCRDSSHPRRHLRPASR